MDADAPEEIRNEDPLADAFLFAETMPLKKKHKTSVAKNRGSYRKYTVEQIEKLFDLIIEEGFPIKVAALVTGINIRTTQNYVKMYNDDPRERLPGSLNKPRGRPCSSVN